MNGNHEPSVAPGRPDATLEIPAVSEARASSRAAHDEAFEALLVAASRAQQAMAATRRGTSGAQ
jgi:hypothetical protein